MHAPEDIKDIATALAKAQGEMKNAPLNRTNPHFKSKYADLSSIRDAVVPALSANGIAVTQLLVHAGDHIIIRTMLIHAGSGQHLESTYPVPLDKPQIMGSNITYAKRYTLAAMCGISADEDDDGNAAQQGKPMSVAQAKKELNWPEIERWIRSADSDRKLNTARERIEANVGIWPASYIEQARELVENQTMAVASTAAMQTHINAVSDAPDAMALDAAWGAAEAQRSILSAEDWAEVEAIYNERLGAFAEAAE